MQTELEEPKTKAVRPRSSTPMAQRIRAHDWASTPLGPIESWPANLRCAVDLVLGCGFPAALQWGPELLFIYNDAYISLLGTRHPSAFGQPVLESFPEVAETYQPIVDRLWSGETVTTENQLYRYTRNNAPADAWFDISYSPVHACDGSVAGIFLICIETTARVLAERERESAERARRQSEQRLTRVLETDAVGILFFNLTGAVVDANDVFVRMTGYTREDIASGQLNWRVMTPPEYVAASEVQMERFKSTGRIGPYEKEYILKDGTRRWMLFAGRALDDGTIAEYCIDISDRRRAETGLRQSEKLAVVRRLASSIAHEINNPLEAIINLIYLAQRGASPEASGYLRQAQLELARVAQIASETLRFNRRNARASATAISDLVDSVLALHDGRIRAAQIQIERRYREHEPILVFANELRQVIANLISNAIRAMIDSKHGRLFVRVRQANDPRCGRSGVRLTIADTGTGMTPATLRRLFEPFFTTRESTSTGLGLWVTHDIVHKHGGSLRVRSRTAHDYSGTVFSIFIPGA